MNAYNNMALNALATYNAAMLEAEISRSEAEFSASRGYSLHSYENDADYARQQFETSRQHALAMLDAAIAELLSLSGEKQDVTDIEREAANVYNDHFVDYCFAQLEAEVGYYSEVVAAMEGYSEAVSTAEQEAQHAILVAEHVLEAHGFMIEPTQTVFYGKCKSCME